MRHLGVMRLVEAEALAAAARDRETDGAPEARLAARAGPTKGEAADLLAAARGLGLTSRLSTARAGETWLGTSPPANVTQVTIPRSLCRLLRPMPAPDRVHTGTGWRHVQAAVGRNTRREARQQAPGQIANEKWLTARSSAPTRERQRL